MQTRISRTAVATTSNKKSAHLTTVERCAPTNESVVITIHSLFDCATDRHVVFCFLQSKWITQWVTYLCGGHIYE